MVKDHWMGVLYIKGPEKATKSPVRDVLTASGGRSR
jgi:hypothetical protein